MRPTSRISFSSWCVRSVLSTAIALLLLIAPGVRGAEPAIVTFDTGVAFFRASDGAELPLRSWLPEGKPKAVLIALHGFADYSASWKRSATLWARDGIATFAYDQRGFGAAPDIFHWSSTDRMVADADEAAATLRARYPGVPVYLIGESMGGAVAIAAATAATPIRVDGMILVSPAVWEHSLLGTIERTALWFTELAIPGLWLSAPPGLHIHPSDNVEMLRAMGRDSLVQFGARADTTAGLMDLMDKAGSQVGHIRLPTLVLFGEHEEVLPRQAVTAFLSHLPKAPIRVALYPKGYHMLLRDLNGDIVAKDVASWVTDRSAPLPSGDECRGPAANAAPCRH